VQRLRHKQGHYLWSCIRGKIVTYDALGKPIRMTGTFGDITQKKEAEEKFRIYQKIFSSTNEGIMVTDKNLKILKVNTAFEKITGFTEQQVKCKPIAIFHSDKHSSSFYSHIHQTLAQDGSWQGEIWEKRQCGDTYPQWLSISSIYDEKNTLLYYVGIFRDLTKNRQIEEQLEYLSNYDLVTELPNRNWYLLKLQRAIHFAQQCQEPLAVVMLGIDKFKTIDDTLGYETGDQLLKKITQRLKKIVPNVDNISTLSRDEFAFFLDGQVTHSSITKIVKKLIAKLNHCFYINSQELLVNIYVGISLYPKDAQDAKSILANANTAMCEIKKNERNAFLFFEPYMNTQRLERVRMESLLRNALVNNELMLYYQPKIDTLSGKISGCEALLRWDNPELGLVSPEKFIPLAEEIGLIVPIGNWVIQQACEQAAQWVQLGFHELRVSVNVSGHQFFKSGLDQWVAQILAQTQLAPHNLEL
jgi:diguanylate cyclase (GGDEF)-like protein/PAS domain S-box-containing protein